MMSKHTKGLKEIPKEITVCNLEVIVMPQGEIICLGKTVGWFKELKSCLSKADINAELLEACKIALESDYLSTNLDNILKQAIAKAEGK